MQQTRTQGSVTLQLMVWLLLGSNIGRNWSTRNGLVAMNSKFGWLISEPIKNSSESSNFTHSNLVVQGPSTIPPSLDSKYKLEKELHCFWDIESLRIVDDIEPTTRVEGFPPQISTRWGYHGNSVSLCKNYGLCVKRLNQLKSCLLREPSLMTEYNTIFKTQLGEGIIECVPRIQDSVISFLTIVLFKRTRIPLNWELCSMDLPSPCIP